MHSFDRMASSNPGYEAGSDDSVATSRTNAATKRSTVANVTTADQQPDEGTYIVGHQTYFADEKVIVPDIDKVKWAYTFLLQQSNRMPGKDLNGNMYSIRWTYSSIRQMRNITNVSYIRCVMEYIICKAVLVTNAVRLSCGSFDYGMQFALKINLP